MKMVYIFLPFLQVRGANALSSPFTIGFPSITSYMGFGHAFERKLSGLVGFFIVERVAIISHDFKLRVHRGQGDHVNSIVGFSRPVNSDGSRSSFIEDALCDLTVSLILEVFVNEEDEDRFSEKEFIDTIYSLVLRMKLSGGDILSAGMPFCGRFDEADKLKDMRKIVASLMPGYAIIERRDLMISAMQGGKNAMEAIVDYVAIDRTCEIISEDERGVKFIWHVKEKERGHIVPISTGFQAISPISSAKNQRDENVPHRFAESVVTLGEFKMVNKFSKLSDIFWSYSVDLEKDLYICTQSG